jgi:hypothetical protein
MSSNSPSITKAHHMKYLTKIKDNYRVSVQTQNFYSDNMLNYYLSQKFKCIKIVNIIINIPTFSIHQFLVIILRTYQETISNTINSFLMSQDLAQRSHMNNNKS